MSLQEENLAKRPRRDHQSHLRTGIGFLSHEEAGTTDFSYFGIGAVPVQPLYEAIEMSTAELLQVLEKANVATVLSQQQQQSQDACYDIHLPKKFTEEWVKEHVHAVFMDDNEELRDLVASVVETDPATKLNKLSAFQSKTKDFFGYELRVPVEKKTTQYIKMEAL